MKQITIIAIVFVLFASLASAHFMSEYPDFIMDDNKIGAIVVVGQKASSSHVIAQSQIISSLSMLVDERPQGIAKLDTEVDGISNRNIISIGSACINSITAEILKNPEPCDGGIAAGKAAIHVLEGENEEVYIVITAFSDKGIRKAAEVMANYEDYDLDGDLITIDVEDDIETEEDEEEIEDENEEAESDDSNGIERHDEINQQEDADDTMAESAEEADSLDTETAEKTKSLLKDIMDWIRDLFKK